MPDIFWMSVVWGIILALFGLGAAVMWRDTRQYRRWSTTEGKIIAARSVFQANNPTDSNYDSSDTELLNVPQIEFEYKVGGQTLRGSRISMVAKDHRYHVARSTLARYPVGKTVYVFFDPDNPTSAALERSLTKSDYIPLGWLLLVCLLTPWLIGVFLCQVYLRIEPRFGGSGGAQVATGIIGFGAFFVILSVGAMATVVRSWSWPVTVGRIKSSTVDSFVVTSDESSYTSFKPRVHYTYEVADQKYTSDRINFSFVLGGPSKRKAERIASRYRKKDAVKVYYNPRRPQESVLRRIGEGTLLFPVIAALFLGIAWAMVQ